MAITSSCSGEQSKFIGKWVKQGQPKTNFEIFKDKSLVYAEQNSLGHVIDGIPGTWDTLSDGRIKITINFPLLGPIVVFGSIEGNKMRTKFGGGEDIFIKYNK